MMPESAAPPSTVPSDTPSAESVSPLQIPDSAPPEIGGRGGLDPTRYGDWEKKGIAIDF